MGRRLLFYVQCDDYKSRMQDKFSSSLFGLVDVSTKGK